MYYESLTKQYPVSKTIRNRLIPIGATQDNIDRDNILNADLERGEKYKKAKHILDSYHRKVIEDSLKNRKIGNLDELSTLYFKSNRSVEESNKMSELMTKMRKEIASFFKKHENFKFLDKSKEIFDTILPKFVTTEEEYDIVSSFKGFTTYFTNYNAVRMNLYSDEEKSSTVAYRLINENLPKYLDNIRTYQIVKKNDISISEIEDELKDIFIPECYSNFITQENIDLYNSLIGKLNSQINLFVQKTKTRVPKMKELYKQLMSEKEGSFIEEYKDDDELLDSLNSFSNRLDSLINSKIIKDYIAILEASDGTGIFIKNDVALTSYSKICFSSWDSITNALIVDYDDNYTGKKKGEKYEEERKKILASKKSIELKTIGALFDSTGLPEYKRRLVDDVNKINEKKKEYSEIIKKHDRSRKISKNNDAIEGIKSYLDSIKELERDLKLLKGTGLEADKDINVSSTMEEILYSFIELDVIYNMTRNYVTKKPFSTEKFKLNFNRPTLLDGWDRNKEEANLGILLFKDNHYYLGIMNPAYNKCFRNVPTATSNDVYSKIEYKLLPGPNKMLPKVFFAKSNVDYYGPSQDILEKYELGTHKKGDSFNLKDCHGLIDFFKESINKHEDWSKFNFEFSDTSTYKDISDFYREVEKQGYKITYSDIDSSYIDSLVNEGKLYLFQIYNKDFSEYSKGNLNLHTIYFKMLFDQRNLDDVVYKLNGQAEVFYRPRSISEEEIILHKANEVIENKNINNEKKTSCFDYDLIKDRRYTVDEFFLHVPITANFGSTDKSQSMYNRIVNETLKADDTVNVIGIDRGERNLLYLTVVDRAGHILEQMSLNSIINGNHETDYHELLDRKEGDRLKARTNWKTIENIKELKEGYLSQIIRVIVDLMIKYNAIVVLENLNSSFMQKRTGKFEKAVYQKFEKMLIDKLNLLVLDKSREQRNALSVGGALNPLQLTAKFESFKMIGDQTGSIFYVPAYLTSKIDPTTGFVNLFYLKYESVEKTRDFFSKFESIKFNKEDYFEFKFDYDNFTDRASLTQWTVCTYGKRISKFRNKEKNNMWEDEILYPTVMLKELLTKYGVPYETGRELKSDIIAIKESDFYKGLVFIFNKTLQMRNSNTSGDEDYIISPVKNATGNFFISGIDNRLPLDADANGAYNIARKGIWVLEQIKKSEDLSKIKFKMTNKEWLSYAETHILEMI